jgi:hypothetical protein
VRKWPWPKVGRPGLSRSELRPIEGSRREMASDESGGS